MASFDIDQTAKAYDPRNPPPGPFWANLENRLRWAGLLLLLAVVYGLPLALIGWLLH